MKQPILALLTAVLLAGTASAAPMYEVSYESAPGAGDFDSNLIALITAHSDPATASAFYSYGAPNPASYNGSIPVISNQTNLFLLNAADGLSLFVVHDQANDVGGGSADTTVDLVNDIAAILVNDDPGGESGTDTGGVQFDFDQNWIACCTDGFVIGALDGAFEAFIQFNDNPAGIEGVSILSASGDIFGLELNDDFMAGQRIRIRPVAIPEPASLAVWSLLGVAAIGYRRRRRNGSSR